MHPTLSAAENSFLKLSSFKYNCADHFLLHSLIRGSSIWFPYIHIHLLILHGFITKPTKWPTHSWLVSSVGRAPHRYRRVLGSQSWIFSWLWVFTTVGLVFITAYLLHLHKYLSIILTSTAKNHIFEVNIQVKLNVARFYWFHTSKKKLKSGWLDWSRLKLHRNLCTLDSKATFSRNRPLCWDFTDQTQAFYWKTARVLGVRSIKRTNELLRQISRHRCYDCPA